MDERASIPIGYVDCADGLTLTTLIPVLAEEEPKYVNCLILLGLILASLFYVIRYRPLASQLADKK